MKYYRLEDREHKDIIVKANGAEQYIYKRKVDKDRDNDRVYE